MRQRPNDIRSIDHDAVFRKRPRATIRAVVLVVSGDGRYPITALVPGANARDTQDVA
jgi:hypothetical protein